MYVRTYAICYIIVKLRKVAVPTRLDSARAGERKEKKERQRKTERKKSYSHITRPGFAEKK